MKTATLLLIIIFLRKAEIVFGDDVVLEKLSNDVSKATEGLNKLPPTDGSHPTRQSKIVETIVEVDEKVRKRLHDAIDENKRCTDGDFFVPEICEDVEAGKQKLHEKVEEVGGTLDHVAEVVKDRIRRVANFVLTEAEDALEHVPLSAPFHDDDG